MSTDYSTTIPQLRPGKCWLSVAIALCGVVIGGCANMIGMQPQGETILAPQHASVSPNYAPEQITKVAIFPLFASGTANDLLADRLVSGISSEVESRHPEWEVVSHRELTRLITEHGLMTGFRNLEADHNSYSGPHGIMLLSPATQDFLKQLREVSGIDAILVGSYSFSVQSEPVRTLGGEIRYQQREVSSVTLSLLHTPTQKNWWIATASRPGPRDAVARAIAQTLASHIGLGARRQL